jgi:hypothetical protein
MNIAFIRLKWYSKDVSQKHDLSAELPEVMAQLKKQMLSIYVSVLAEGYPYDSDWPRGDGTVPQKKMEIGPYRSDRFEVKVESALQY